MTPKLPHSAKLKQDVALPIHTAVGRVDEARLLGEEPAGIAAAIVAAVFDPASHQIKLKSEQPSFEAGEGRARLIFILERDNPAFQLHARNLLAEGWCIGREDERLWIASIGGKDEAALRLQIEKRQKEITAAISAFNAEYTAAQTQLIAEVTKDIKQKRSAVESQDKLASMLTNIGLKPFERPKTLDEQK